MNRSESIITSRKKIIICLQADHYPEKIFHFASDYFNQPENVFKVLVFKNQHNELENSFSDDRVAPVLVPNRTASIKSVARRILNTEQTSKRPRILIHMVNSANLSELLKDTLYADVLIVSDNLCNRFSQYNPHHTNFTQIKSMIRCPMVVVPSIWEAFREMMLVYDGKLATFLSIKNLITFFPMLFQTMSVTLMVVLPEEESAWEAREEKLLIDYLKFHCHDLAIHKVFHANTKTLGTALNLHAGALLVKQDPACMFPPGLNKVFSNLECIQLFNFH